MLVVETVAKVRRAYFVQKKPIKAICRELGLSRKVVRKVIRSQATEFHYNRENWSKPKIGPWRDELDALLSANEAKAARERLTVEEVSPVCRRSLNRRRNECRSARRVGLRCRRRPSRP